MDSSIESVVWNLVASLIGKAVGLIVTSGAMSLLWAKRQKIAGPVLVFLFTATCITFFFFGATGRGLFSTRAPETTPENIQENVRKWADTFGWAIQKEQSNSDNWGFTISKSNSSPHIGVSVPKQFPKYLDLTNVLIFTADQRKFLASLNPQDTQSVQEDITIALAQMRVSYTFLGNGSSPDALRIEESIAITPELTEAAFIEHFDRMNVCSLGASAAILKAMSRGH
jgi:hypothetical protein